MNIGGYGRWHCPKMLVILIPLFFSCQVILKISLHEMYLLHNSFLSILNILNLGTSSHIHWTRCAWPLKMSFDYTRNKHRWYKPVFWNLCLHEAKVVVDGILLFIKMWRVCTQEWPLKCVLEIFWWLLRRLLCNKVARRRRRTTHLLLLETVCVHTRSSPCLFKPMSLLLHYYCICTTPECEMI